MPIPIPGPNEVEVRPVREPYYVRQTQDWQIEQERRRHIQALYTVGEWAIWILMWHDLDLNAGLVTRCQRCYSNSGSLLNQAADVYNQPTVNKCPDCFGTTFEGGYRARIVRPAIFTDADETEQQDKKGSMHPAQVNVESTPDFRVRQGDYVFRSDNTRWQLSTPNRVQLRTGFAHPTQADSSITYNNAPAKLEDHTSVAYMIPPTDAAMMRLVLSQPLRQPGNFDLVESIHGPLIPDGMVP